MSKRALLSLIVTFISALSLSVVLAATGTTASVGATAPTRSAPAAQSAAAASPNTVVARNIQGRAASRLVGTTRAGRAVTGSFTPLHFSRSRTGNKLLVRGLVSGVTQSAGHTTTFSVLRTVRVTRINGVPATTRSTTARAAAGCDVLNLVLGPLDLNLLGLHIDLSRIILNIVAVPGAGNLLGNLLCAVAGLLDGGLSGVLNRVIALLNQILANLRLGG